jgi:MYXO-CTERM domain-containing protein
VVGVKFFDCTRGVASGVACIGGCDTEDPTFVSLVWNTSDAGATWEFDPDFETVMTGGQLMPEAKKLSSMLHLQFPGINQGFLAGQHAMVLRYDALSPEAEPGPAPDTCEGGNNNNNNNNTNNGTGDPDGSDSGCGCRTGSRAPAAPALPFLVALVLGLALRRRN